LKDPQLRSDWQDFGMCEEAPPSFTNGNLPGNEWTSERIIGANASMYNDFKIKERFMAQIRLDYFNPFKWFNWTSFTTMMNQSTPETEYFWSRIVKEGLVRLGDLPDSHAISISSTFTVIRA
jgi:hypothetical protein